MINFMLYLPSFGRGNIKDLVSKYGPTPMKNKYYELEITYADWTRLIGLSLDFSFRCDHAGLRAEFTLLGAAISFQIYDNRHWDYHNREWFKI